MISMCCTIFRTDLRRPKSSRRQPWIIYNLPYIILSYNNEPFIMNMGWQQWCWRLIDGARYKMLVAEKISQSCHQHKLSPTSVTNINLVICKISHDVIFGSFEFKKKVSVGNKFHYITFYWGSKILNSKKP